MKHLAILPLAALAFAGCKEEPDDPIIPNEEEFISTVKLELIEAQTNDTLWFQFTDLDGDGGNDPVISIDTLSTGSIYQANLYLLNETETPADSIHNEVEEEGLEHQVFFQFSSNDLSISYSDSDTDGNPIGLETEWETNNETQTILTLTLRHEPNKDAPGVADGDISQAGGETDVEVDFPIYIK